MSQTEPLSASAPSPRAQRTRERILDAAGQCFASSGYARTTVEEVARRAGVSKALVYHHIGSKEKILAAVVTRTLDEWETAELAALENEDVLVAIAAMHRTGLDCARSHPALQALLELDTQVLLGADAGQAVRASVERLNDALISVLQAGVASGQLREDLSVELAAQVITLNHFALIQHVLDPGWVDVSDELVESGIEILLRGLERR